MRAAEYPSKKQGSPQDKKRVLRKALIRTAENLSLSRQELSVILGPSESSLSRLFIKTDYYLDPSSKEGELAVLLIRVYRNLDILFGGNTEQCRQWLKSDNAHLGVPPLLLMQSVPGLAYTVEYLDAMRGKN